MTRARRVKAGALAVGMLMAGCSGGGGLVRSESEAAPPLEWQKDAGLLGERWRQRVSGHLMLTGAAVDTERIYVGAKDGVVALDLETGEELWRADTPVAGQAPVVVGDRVLLAAGNGERLVALDAATGEEAWATDAHASGAPGTTIAVAAGAPVVTDIDGVVALDATDGRQVWRKPSPPVGEPDLQGPVLVDGNLVFVHTERPTEVIALDAQTGGEVWRQPVRASRQAPWFYAGGGLVFLAESGVGDDKPAGLVALDAATGRQRWDVTLPAPTLSPPVRLGDLMVFSTGKGAHALALSDGRVRFSALEEFEYPRIAPCGETVCVSHLTLQLVDADGTVVQEIEPPEISILPPATFLNAIIVLDSAGTVYRYR